MLRKVYALRSRPEILFPTITLVIGLIILSIAPGIISSQQVRLAVQNIKDHRRQVPIVQANFSTYKGEALANAPLGTTIKATSCAHPTIDLKMLVISADGSEVDLPAIQQTMDYTGTPYTQYIASKSLGQLTADKLFTDCHAFYQGVILTTGNLAYNNNGAWSSALTQTEWNTLWTFESIFKVRQVTWYTFPTADFGFQNSGSVTGIDTSTTPVTVALTKVGHGLFPYLNAGIALQIQNAYTFTVPATVEAATKPVLVDGNGNTLAALHSYPDGRQNLALTFDSNQYLTHSIVLSYGLLNWVTKGLFLGDRHVFLESQIDDIFLDDNTWAPATPCGTSVDASTTNFRIDGNDLHTVALWQKAYNKQPTTRQFKLDMVFNGYGSTGVYSPDSLTTQAQRDQGNFIWTNHTYDHLNLDLVDYATAQGEILSNDAIAAQLRLHNFTTLAMVTPDVSGLKNTNYLQAAWDSGIRYVVTDTSLAGYTNPSPNTGIYNNPSIPYIPGILATLGLPDTSLLMIPRHPTNLFFNVSTPDEWVAEYNCLYHAFWGRDLAYQEILDKESGQLLVDLLKGDVDPAMYHQPNLRAYDGTHTLLGDLLDMTLSKYNALYNLPVISLRMDALGGVMASRMQYNQAGVTASYTPNGSITLTAQKAVTIPVTGLSSGSQTTTTYGGQHISFITLAAGQSVTLSL